MNKFKKIVLVSGLALSSLAVMPVGGAQQASAAELNNEISTQSDAPLSVVQFRMLKNQLKSLYGYSRLEIVSGYGVVTLTSPEVLKAVKSGKAVVNAYDVYGGYIRYEITVQ